MKKIGAIAKLTIQAALRFRLIPVLLLALLGLIACIPFTVKHDGSAEMFTQVVLTYTLSATTLILGFVSLWLGCGTLSQDLSERQIQMVDVKPVARWQVWLGKWLGILAMNALLLAVVGSSVYGLILWQSKTLSPEERTNLFQKVLVARGTVKESLEDREKDVELLAGKQFDEARESGLSAEEFQRYAHSLVEARHERVPPGYRRIWKLDLGGSGASLKDKPLQIRSKFYAAQKIGEDLYSAFWQIGNDSTGVYWRTNMTMAHNAFQEFTIPPNLFDEKGELIVEFHNRNETTLLFSAEDGLELYYPEGGFPLNLGRALGVILCWMAALSALGLTASTFLSFPVACFFAMSLLLAAFSTPLIQDIVKEGAVFEAEDEHADHQELSAGKRMVNKTLVPVFSVLLGAMDWILDVAPIESVSSGRSITWMQTTLAALKFIPLICGLLGCAGVWIFNRRELASIQSTQ